MITKRRLLAALLVLFTLVAAAAAAGYGPPLPEAANCYLPVEGGWRIRLSGNPSVSDLPPDQYIGAAKDNAREHFRPLYPPADRRLMGWNEQQLTQLERVAFRPLVLAANGPRFLFDFHTHGGLLGHLMLGWRPATGPGKWLSDWQDIGVQYVFGRLEYELRDPAFPGVVVRLKAMALADAAGGLLRVTVANAPAGSSLVYAYGGASADLTWALPDLTYAPQQCAGNQLRWEDGRFELSRGFLETEPIVADHSWIYTVPRLMPNWKARVLFSASAGRPGFAPPDAIKHSPRDFVRAVNWIPQARPSQRRDVLAALVAPINEAHAEMYVVIGMGDKMSQIVRQPAEAESAALSRNQTIADRLVIRTPDPYLNAAMTTLAFSTEGLWGDRVILHGNWSWRMNYLGWRSCYGPVCYGYTERVRESIRNHIRYSYLTEGADRDGMAIALDFPKLVHYNMQEVFIDMVRQYYEYTDDVELMREIFPVLKSVVEWELRRLQPERELLFENALNTFISDSHWYRGGQCTQASAYMLRAHEFLGRLANRLGENGEAYRVRAAGIREAMQRKLWLPAEGVFAEYLDTRNNRLLHAEPELPSLYHAAEFGAANSMQAYQMTIWGEDHLRNSPTPGGGRTFWTSNWFPNNGRSYTHSTYDVSVGDNLNFAGTHYLAGRAERGYELIRGALSAVFSGLAPGGLPAQAFEDGRQRANYEFADAISMWGRTVSEDLFGIVPNRPANMVTLTPQLPEDWPEASIRTPHLRYTLARQEDRVTINWESPVATRVQLRWPLRKSRLNGVEVDGKAVTPQIQPAVGYAQVLAHSDAGLRRGSFTIRWTAVPQANPVPLTVRSGEPVQIPLSDYEAEDWHDPQSLLDRTERRGHVLHGVARQRPGSGVLLLATGAKHYNAWVPLKLKIEPAVPQNAPVWQSPRTAKGDLRPWRLMDLGGLFNASVPEVCRRIGEAAIGPPEPHSQVGFKYWREHVSQVIYGNDGNKVSDAAWRKKVGADGIAWTGDNIPFKTVKEGNNIAVVTMEAGFPNRLDFPVGIVGERLYLMISGITFPVQSWVPNLRVILHYADAIAETHDLVNPTSIGDGWSTWLQRYHDTPANGFENIGGRRGPSSSAQVEDLSRPILVDDTEAHLVPFVLRAGIALQRVEVVAVANDCVFGVMGASVLATPAVQ